MLECWDQEPTVRYEPALYLSSPETIIAMIQSEGNEAGTLMIVAHNPGIAIVASTLAHRAVEMPTAAVAVFDLTVDDLHSLGGPSDLTLDEYMRPKALK